MVSKALSGIVNAVLSGLHFFNSRNHYPFQPCNKIRYESVVIPIDLQTAFSKGTKWAGLSIELWDEATVVGDRVRFLYFLNFVCLISLHCLSSHCIAFLLISDLLYGRAPTFEQFLGRVFLSQTMVARMLLRPDASSIVAFQRMSRNGDLEGQEDQEVGKGG